MEYADGTGMADYNGKYSYAYDELNRLTEVSKDGKILKYAVYNLENGRLEMLERIK